MKPVKMKCSVKTIIFLTAVMAEALLPLALETANAAADRGRIVFVSADSGRWELWTAEARDAALHQLSDTAQDERTPRWSPDGSGVAYATAQGALQVLNLHSQEIETLQVSTVRNAEPAWSPDGRALVYVSYSQPRKRKTELWVAYFEDRGLRSEQLLVPEGLKTFPHWSPDGRGIVYSRLITMEPSGPVEDICRFDLKVEKEKTLIANGFDNIQPAWSPDGQWLAYASNQSGNYDIWLWRPDWAAPRQLTRDPALDRAPAWSPDGMEIAFVSARTGVQQIWVVDVVSGRERQITFGETDSRDPAWGR